MPVPAVIELAFDPVVRVGDIVLRWQTLGVTAALLAGLVLAAVIRGYVPTAAAIVRPAPPKGMHRPVRRRLVGATFPDAPEIDARVEPDGPLRLDDLMFIVLGVVPGAVMGGRLVHGLVFWQGYAAQPERLLDAQTGSLSLLGAVLGGTLTGAVVCRLIGAPVRRWADVAGLPMLVVVGLGKFAQLLGGSGQGAPFDGPWAVALLGDGPWVSAAASLPAHPSQVYEAVWALLGIPFVLALAGRGPDHGWVLRVGGRLFVVSLAWFIVGRVVVGFTWRDDTVLGPFNAEQLLALFCLAVILGLSGIHALRGRLRRGRSGSARYGDAVPQE